MNTFNEIIGHDVIKSYFKKVLEKKNISHSYIFEGQVGVGRKLMANALAKNLLCNTPIDNQSCNKCELCHQFDIGNHPDIIRVEKDTQITKIDTIRTKIIQELNIKPYQSNYKIVIINEAETLAVDSQNALLKSIEEPPAYAIIILVTNNMDKLLPTIKSRCIHIRFNDLLDTEMVSYLNKQVYDQSRAKIYLKFANGSIGTMQKLMLDEEFLELRNKSINYLIQLQTADMIKLYDIVNTLIEDKEKLINILDFWILWYRDIMLCKRIVTTNLYYYDYQSTLLDIASKLTYNKISIDMKNIQKSRMDITKNIYPLFVIENLLMKLKEK